MKKWKIYVLAAVMTALLSGCSAGSSGPMTYTDTVFDTVISVQIYDSKDKELLNDIKKMCRDYENLFSNTIETSEISQINNAKGETVQVSAETAALIKKGLYYGEMSNGALDITMGSVTSLWNFKAEKAAVPSKTKLLEALEHVDYKKVSVDGTTVQLKDPETSLDVGAIAKGYIADRLKDYLKKQSVRHALINLGGNVLAIGTKPDGTPFNIGIQKPFTDSGIPLTSVKIDDKSLVTSGTYQRYFKKGDTIYHHILDPKTGKPCDNGLSSVTILTDSSLAADALSTTCFILGPEKGMKLVNQFDNVEAVFVSEDNEISYSDNFQKK